MKFGQYGRLHGCVSKTVRPPREAAGLGKFETAEQTLSACPAEAMLTGGETSAPGELMSLAVRQFGIAIDHVAKPTDARSGARVHRARTLGGRAAYLKLTPAVLGPETLDAARRELRFYRQLAAEVPVQTPPLLDSFEVDLGVALLLAAAGEQVKVSAWSGTARSMLGRDLAALHSVQVAGQDWVRPDALLDTMSAPVSGTIAKFWGGVLPGLRELLDSRRALREELASQPAVLVHGDCHTGNIVHAGDGLVFWDWQSTGLGRATSDLAMLGVRAAPAGIGVPRDAMKAYVNQRGCDVNELERALILEELAIFVFQWPPFADYNSRARIARVHDRTRDLAARWFAMTSPERLPT
jgi:Ser/Thr protein kinase RdoA (MazF antagonist)